MHHASPAEPLESTSPDNIQKSAHIGTFRKGGNTKLTFVQPVQIVAYTQSLSVDQMSHSQTAQGDWRCGSHSDGGVCQASFTGASAIGRRQKEPRGDSSELILGAVGQQHGLVLTAGPGLSRLLWLPDLPPLVFEAVPPLAVNHSDAVKGADD